MWYGSGRQVAGTPPCTRTPTLPRSEDDRLPGYSPLRSILNREGHPNCAFQAPTRCGGGHRVLRLGELCLIMQ